MFKKIIAAALAALTLTTVGGTALAASYSGPINVSNNPKYYYHTCKVDGCGHYADLKYLSLNARVIGDMYIQEMKDMKIAINIYLLLHME